MTMPAPLPSHWPSPLTGTVVILGGTFDPVHIGHIALARRVVESLSITPGSTTPVRALFIPAARSPHKSAGPRAGDEHRVRMLEVALRGWADAGVWTDELARPAPSYTVDTLERLRTLVPGVTLRLLLGQDQAVAFHRWREPRRIIELAPPIVLPRRQHAGFSATSAQSPGALADALRVSGFWSEPEIERWCGALIDVGLLEVSSTQVRALLAAGTITADAQVGPYLPPGVLEYIRERALYE